CINYAVSNNLSIKQAALQVHSSELSYKQSKASRLPSLNFGINSGYNFGLSENPTTGILENRKNFNSTIGIQSGITLFNWFSTRNSIEAVSLTNKADKAQVEKVKNDVSLNILAAYLQILLAKEKTEIAVLQIKQTTAQLEQTRKKVDAGVLPELNALELEAQLAEDSSVYISSQSAVQQSLLQMKVFLGLDASVPLDIDAPAIEAIPLQNISELQPEHLFTLALKNLPQQKENELRIGSASKAVSATKAQMYPLFSLFANLNSRYAYTKIPVYSQVVTGYQSTAFRVDAGSGNYYMVETPVITQGLLKGYSISDPFSNQLWQNFGQGIGFSMQIPILNGQRARTNFERAKLSLKQTELEEELDKQSLKQDIYKIFNDATVALEKYNAHKKTLSAAEKAFDFAQKRYNINLLSTSDLITIQSKLLKARIEIISAQYDYVFKRKLLEFYKGEGLKF
ncbi:MAG TPA: TolC family protein, partial [Flavisolibacter sp.]|nr:TolC family protein [Flavisolibacter sp.]